MYCIKCGTNNSDEAKFCRKCGEAMEAEEETRVAVRDAVPTENHPVTEAVPPRSSRKEESLEGGAPVFSIGPTMKFVKAGYVLAALGALLLAAVLGIFGISAWYSVVVGLMLFLVPAYYHVKQKLVRYTLTDTQIEVDAGLISRTTRNIPLRRVQDVTVTTSAMQRLLGFGDIVIDNASEEGGKVVLDNIDQPKKYADMMLKQMRLLDR